jgi:hypothetical protein
MKFPIIITGAIVFGLMAEGAVAACPASGRTPVANLSTFLLGKTACVGSPGNWTNQEEHRTGGVLADYKKGPGDPIDPTKTIGTWAVSTSGDVVTYNYGASGPYSFNLYSNVDGTYDFCNAGPGSANDVSNVMLQNSFGGCPSPAP